MDGASESSKSSGVPTNFLSLPRELRNQIYVYCLVDEENVGLTFPSGQSLSPQLLRTNKAIHDEATEVLYAHNRFEFTACSSDRLASFLDQIGFNNSKQIRHIYICFPKFQHLHIGDFTMTYNSSSILEKLQDCCPNLRTLTTSLDSINSLDCRFKGPEHLNAVTEALKLVDARFRAISSLPEKENHTTPSCQPSQPKLEPGSSFTLITATSIPSPCHDSGNPMLSIIVEVYQDGFNDDIRRTMKSYGWTLDTAVRWGQSDYFGYSDSGCDSGWSSSDEDDYDIDNDSEF